VCCSVLQRVAVALKRNADDGAIIFIPLNKSNNIYSFGFWFEEVWSLGMNAVHCETHCNTLLFRSTCEIQAISLRT